MKIRSIVLSLPIMTVDTLARKRSAFSLISLQPEFLYPFLDPLKKPPAWIRYVLLGRGGLACLSFSQVVLTWSSVPRLGKQSP